MGPRLTVLAWRNLWRNRRRTLLTLASIGFGLLLAVMFTALQDRNFADMIDIAARMGGGHVTLQHPEYQDTPTFTRTVHDTGALVQAAQADPLVDRAVVRVQGQAMAATAGRSVGVFFLAIDPSQEDAETFQLAEGLVAGSWLEGPDDTGLVLGRRLAELLRVDLGGKVVYTVVDKEGEISSGVGRVKGLVSTGSPSADGAMMVLGLDAVREVLGYDPEEATTVAVFAADPRRVRAMRDSLVERGLPEGVAALTWDEVQPDLSAFIAMKVGGARFMELVIMVLVAASIFNTLFVSVLERTREFGILLAIGYSPWQLSRLVVWESGWLGLVGVAAGGLLTAPLYFWLVAHPIPVAALTGGEAMEVAGVGMPPELRIGIFPENLALIAGFVVGATLLAGLYPAWRAGRVQPVEAINLG